MRVFLARAPGVGHFRGGDCFIQSLVNCLAGTSKQLTYLQAEKLAKSYNWENSEGIQPGDWEKALTDLGFTCKAEPAEKISNCLPQFLNGRFIVAVDGHVFAFVHGVAYDDGRHVKLSEIVESIWEIEA